MKRFQILTNMVDSDAQGRRLYGKISRVADRFLDISLGYLGAIPRDEYLRKAVQQQGAVVQIYPRSKSALALKKLADDVSAKNHSTRKTNEKTAIMRPNPPQNALKNVGHDHQSSGLAIFLPGGASLLPGTL